MKKHATRIDKLVKSPLWQDFLDYLNFWHRYVKNRAYIPFSFFEAVKDFLVVGLYKDRGKKARPILHLGAMGMTFFVVIFAPLLFEKRDSEIDERRGNVLAASSNELSFYTIQAEEVKRLRGGEVVLHEVKEGEDLAGIASLYGLKKETIMWENNLRENSKLSVGSNLRILPVDGVYHKVSKGESVESIGKKYGLEAAQTQAIVDFPFNEFLNDKFELAPGQWLMIPGGIKRIKSEASPTYARVLTPDAGTVNATGSFIWPASGIITQGYSFYHKAIDIAGSGSILAADSGVVEIAGWSVYGYGNHVIVNHGNGTKTLYAHMRELSVSSGQSVNRGDVLGQMGSTGRSTGVHLHFEVRQDSVLLNPLDVLK